MNVKLLPAGTVAWSAFRKEAYTPSSACRASLCTDASGSPSTVSTKSFEV